MIGVGRLLKNGVVNTQTDYNSYTDDRLTVMQASYDLIVGCFDCKLSTTNDAYMFVNMDNPSRSVSNRTYKFKVENCSSILVYKGGAASIITANASGEFEITLATGEACFAVCM